MFEHFFASLQRFVLLTARSIGRKRSVALELLTLEERATPAADLLFAYDPPQMVVVAEIAPAIVIHEDANEPIVRVDLMPAGTAVKTGHDVFDVDEWLTDADAETQTEAAATEPAQESSQDEVVVSEEELLNAMMNEMLRKISASVGA